MSRLRPSTLPCLSATPTYYINSSNVYCYHFIKLIQMFMQSLLIAMYSLAFWKYESSHAHFDFLVPDSLALGVMHVLVLIMQGIRLRDVTTQD